MSGFDVDLEELKSAAATLRTFATYPPQRITTLSSVEVYGIRNPSAASMISALVEKGNDNLEDLVTVILALSAGLEKAAMNYGLADAWGGQ